ncbi:TPA: ABC transporter permease, partial [Kluyvera ascorbata]|nr:ABC transporter permease [Kluyvera ascorbata]
MQDFIDAIKRYDLWMALGWNDVLGRYRRSIIGPFWITISMGVTIAAMGPLYSSLFGNKNESFLLHLSLGMVFWGFISSCINESCNIFQDSSSIIKQSDLPISIYNLRVFHRQFIILLHNIVIIPIVMFFSPPHFNLGMVLFIPAMVLTSIFIINLCVILAIFSTRYRDMTPVIQSIMTLL